MLSVHTYDGRNQQAHETVIEAVRLLAQNSVEAHHVEMNPDSLLDMAIGMGWLQQPPREVRTDSDGLHLEYRIGVPLDSRVASITIKAPDREVLVRAEPTLGPGCGVVFDAEGRAILDLRLCGWVESRGW